MKWLIKDIKVIALSKPEKVNLMAEYIDYYQHLINEQGLDALNVKIPREV